MRIAMAVGCIVIMLIPSVAWGQDDFARTYKETSLYWDDGAYDSFDHYLTGYTGDQIAVMFQAPNWANYLTHVYYHVSNDFVDNQVNPEWPTTKAFLASFWRPVDGFTNWPGELANEQAETDSMYAEDEWFEYELPIPLDISDPAEFPGRRFFAGLQWLHDLNPYINYDSSDPLDLFGWTSSDNVWSSFVPGEIMIRAVVSDSLESSVVELKSWSAVKLLYDGTDG